MSTRGMERNEYTSIVVHQYNLPVRIDILTLFPAMFQGPLTESILRRAQDQAFLDIHFHDLRSFGIGKYHQVDDTPYGGGAGMLLRVDVLVKAIESIQQSDLRGQTSEGRRKKLKPYVIYFSPRGKKLKQVMVEKMVKKYEWLILVCGHYEGIDQRVIDGGWIDEELSIGDYVLTGGELPAMALMDALIRQIPGVLHDDASAVQDSFVNGLLDCPHYTRPEVYEGVGVPPVLMGGHHAEIEKWRKENGK